MACFLKLGSRILQVSLRISRVLEALESSFVGYSYHVSRVHDLRIDYSYLIQLNIVFSFHITCLRPKKESTVAIEKEQYEFQVPTINFAII